MPNSHGIDFGAPVRIGRGPTRDGGRRGPCRLSGHVVRA